MSPTIPTNDLPNEQHIVAASHRLSGVVRRTPTLTSSYADHQTGANVFFKCENFQNTGSFKFRGAYNALACLDPQARERGVVTYSSGNHAQALALAAAKLGSKALIVMPSDAPEVKIQATRSYAADIVFFDRETEDREALSKQLAMLRHMDLIPPYDHPDVIAGQGTVALELFEEVGPLDVLVVPTGGGGLLAGCAVASTMLSPQCKIIGVEPDAGDDARQSLRAGHIVHIDVPQTLADGAQTTHLGEYTFPLIKRYVSDITTVSDDALIRTMRFFFERMKLVVEPTGCLAAAAVLESNYPLSGKRVGVIVSGGNVDPKRFAHLLIQPSSG